MYFVRVCMYPNHTTWCSHTSDINTWSVSTYACNLFLCSKFCKQSLYFGNLTKWQFLKKLDRFGGFFVEYEICGSLRNSDITQRTTHSDSFNNGCIDLYTPYSVNIAFQYYYMLFMDSNPSVCQRLCHHRSIICPCSLS